jgi:NAD(P)-dependent dehydrogenase (short-subunit alcohol dehydrogenase family)
MGSRLAGKVALVTGSSSGIGRAAAELFAEEGASVIVNGFPESLGQEVADTIKNAGGKAHYCVADVGVSAELEHLVQFTLGTCGRIDILMNNAISGSSAPVLEQEESEWDRVFSTSVKAAYLGSKFALPHMIAQGGGSIIHTASVHGLLGGRGVSAYDAAKGALVNLTRQMAVDYGQFGIRVNALCPGRIITEAKREWLKTRPEELRRQKIIYPLGRPGTMREVAQAALFLASDESSFVTGHALVVDGGLSVQLQDAAAAHLEAMLGIPPPALSDYMDDPSIN